MFYERFFRAKLGALNWNPDEIDLFAYEKKGDKRFVAVPLSVKEVDIGESIEPFRRISKSEAQQLMNDLWDCGLRPSEGSGSAGAMLATQTHLKDMRVIVFDKLKIKEENL